MSDDFVRDKLMWFDQVRADHGLPPSCLHVALAIASYVNRRSGEAWPSQERLALDCNLSRGGLRKALGGLVTRGHLVVTAGQGRQITSRYRWILRPSAALEKGHRRSPLPSVKGSQAWPLSPNKRVTPVPEKGHSCDNKRVTVVATNTMKEHFEEPTPPSAAYSGAVAGTFAEQPLDLLERFEVEPSSASPSKPADVRSRLFSEGLAILRDLTGKPEKPARSMVGRWLRNAGDDAAHVMAALERAQDLRPAEPIEWLEKATRPNQPLDPAAAAAFNEFRTIFPPCGGANWVAAEASFRRQVTAGADPAAIVDGARAYAGRCKRESTDRRFVARPAKWLDQSEWTAEWGGVSTNPAGAQLSPEKWAQALDRFHRTGAWSAAFGPKPGSPGCLAPVADLSAFKIAGAA